VDIKNKAMIDTIKLKIYGKFDLEAFSQRKDSIFNPESGEITVEKGILQNLKLNYFHRTETLIVEESLKKFMFGEDSIKDLYYADIFTARDKIKDKLGLTDEQIDFAEVIRLDLGINILVDRPAEDYLDIINSHPKLKRVEYPTSVSFIGKKKKIIFYDKYQELLDKKVIKKKWMDTMLIYYDLKYNID